MARRRKNQPKIESLSLLARFLNHVCQQEGFTQAKLAKKIGTSTATLSRWFRDMLSPSDNELKKIAKTTGVPVENFYALRTLDNLGTDKAIDSTSAAVQFLVSGSKIILMSGLTMLAGIVQLRGANLKGKTLLLDTLDPRFTPITNTTRDSINKQIMSDMRARWVAMIGILISIHKKQKGTKIKLWVRNKLVVREEPIIKELVANDYVALESSEASYGCTSYRIHFYNDSFWNYNVEPLFKKMMCNNSVENRSLIWDSEKTKTIDTLIVKKTIALLDVDTLIYGKQLKH